MNETERKFSPVRLLIFPFCFAIALIGDTSCIGMTAGDKEMDKQKTVVTKEQDNGKEIRINRGDILQIELEETGSAGYGWYFDRLDTAHFALLSEETKAISPPGLIGAPVLGIWRLKTLREGSAEIKMNYYRKWEGAEKAQKLFLLKLQISN